MKYLVIYRRKYTASFAVNEFDTPTEMLNAILNGDFEGNEMILARRLALSVTDAVEVPAVEIEQPAAAPAAVVEAA